MALGDHRNGLADPRADEDWFTFTLTEETDVAVRGSAAIDGELQDAGGQAVAGVVSLGLPSTGFAHLATLAPGKYYLKVTPWDRLYTGLYSVYVLEAVEPGSTLATAVPLRFGRMAVGTIDPSSDTDYFRIDLDETADVMLGARGEKVRVHGELQDDSGNAVDGAVLNPVFAGPVGFQLLDQLSAGTHYIKVTGSSNLGIGPDTGRYAVLMSEDVLYTDFTDHCERVATTLSRVGDRRTQVRLHHAALPVQPRVRLRGRQRQGCRRPGRRLAQSAAHAHGGARRLHEGGHGPHQQHLGLQQHLG